MDIVAQINAELDRLGWSSDTAPAGESALDAFPTETEGIVIVSDPQEETAFRAEALLETLKTLETPISYDDLWSEILAYIAED